MVKNQGTFKRSHSKFTILRSSWLNFRDSLQEMELETVRGLLHPIQPEKCQGKGVGRYSLNGIKASGLGQDSPMGILGKLF